MHGYMSKGHLVPPDVVSAALTKRLLADDLKQTGWLADGWTRECANSEWMMSAGFTPDLIIVLDVPEDKLLARLSGRRIDPVTKRTYHVLFSMPEDEQVKARLIQRADDSDESARQRLDVYRKQSSAALAPFRTDGRAKIVTINGDAPPDEVFASISDAWRTRYGSA
eukprot:TRINITY_DN4661_c0_g1_i2.p1 TRINITY_DN4661_c0_g1~~TRINITY_DN4661_c0_g1_i2.p1  ORF type:complete len:167 (+),score=44.76 TRINITY_DN4661_c0_g1_i2:408-908(+)